MQILKSLSDIAKGKVPVGLPRSSLWPKARLQHLLNNPTCSVCGGKDKLEVHHIRPFHLHPDLELDPTNFVTLCESDLNGVNCHLYHGHLGNFKSYNVDVITDAATWLGKLRGRP